MSKPRTAKHFLDLNLLPKDQLRAILDLAKRFKNPGDPLEPEDVTGLPPTSVLAMIFEKPSTRTRVSFDMAIRRLGGQSMVLNSADMQLGRGESIADTARVLSRYIHAIMIRTSSHSNLLELAEYASVPVINGLTDDSHPCQIMADILTFEEYCGPVANRKITWVGDGNNMANSWIHAAERFGFDLWITGPEEYFPSQEVVRQAQDAGAAIHVTTNLHEAVENSACVMTDTWVSMGDSDVEKRHKLLSPYQVNDRLMQLASPEAIFMHCLPAHRGEEVTDSVIDGPQSVVFDEAENRMHAQQAILAWCFGLVK